MVATGFHIGVFLKGNQTVKNNLQHKQQIFTVNGCHSLSVAQVNPYWFYLAGFTFLVPAHPGSPGQNPKGHKMVVCVCEMAIRAEYF